MKKGAIFAVCCLLSAVFFSGGYFYAKRSGASPSIGKSERKVLYWVDPMHPSYKSDKPGIAPDCGMRLEPVYADGGAGPAAAATPAKKLRYYTDPQHPEYRSDKPGLNPETGNDLVPVYDEPAPGSITVSAEKQQLTGVRFGTVEPAHAESTIRAVGRVTIDETRVSRVTTKVEGWVEDVFVDYSGAEVRKGQPLLTIYSPELLASQQEYLLALRSKDVLKASTLDSARQQSDSLIAAARRRLELWDLTVEQIDEIARTGKPVRNITLYSPAGGHILERKAYPKQRATPEMELYTLVDLSRVWIMVDVFESDAARIRPGLTATVTLPSAPGQRTLTATVTHILPQMDPATRTLKVRLELPNPGMRLKPDMFADVDFRFADTARISVPADAVLDTGERKTVFVELGGGVLEPRQVETGKHFGDRIEILRGLEPASGSWPPATSSSIPNPAQKSGGRCGSEALMIDRIIEFSARNRFLVFLLVAFAAPRAGGRCGACRSTPSPT